MNRKIMNIFALLVVFALAFTSTLPAVANPGGGDRAGKFLEEFTDGVYLVQLIDAPVVAYEGDITGLKATKPAKGEKINPNKQDVIKYVGYLDGKHNEVLQKVGGKKLYDYRYTFNGFAAELTAPQAAKMASLPEVVAIERDQLMQMDTATTPDFLGLTAEGGLWEQLGGVGASGEDVIIGIVDSGIWPESMSFSDRTGTNGNNTQDDKLDYQQIPGWHGKCTPGEAFPASLCNQKLIGAQYYNSGWGGNEGIDELFPNDFNSPRDGDGHGTHTASTAGGNFGIEATAHFSIQSMLGRR
jgi:subtilisin family serine protease